MSRTGKNIQRAPRNVKRGAFTLIEVLVVVAIIALLISILLPSLKQARDVAKMTVCLSHLKEQGNAMQMYIVDAKDALPGPLHPLFLAYPQDMTLGGSYTEAQKKFIMSGYLNTRLRKYFGETTFGRGGTSKEVGTCPAFPIRDEVFKQTTGSPIFHYGLNNSSLTGPNYYFGFTFATITSQQDWENTYRDKPEYHSKKLSRVLGDRVNAGSEWMIADSFRRALPARSVWPESNEPGWEIFGSSMNPDKYWEYGSLAPNLLEDRALASARVAPNAPFHGKGGSHKVPLPGGGGTTGQFYGKVNTLYFDMHAATQNGWKGTVRPLKLYDKFGARK